jgi:hypothetical protein
MAIIDQKPSKRRWDNNPRIVRAKPQPAALTDDPMLYRDEKTYRRQLWNDCAAFVKSHGGFVVSPPNHGTVRCQVPLGNGALEKAMEALPRYPVTKLMSTAIRLSQHGFRQMAELEIILWRG